jgi:hypothetical protein
MLPSRWRWSRLVDRTDQAEGREAEEREHGHGEEPERRVEPQHHAPHPHEHEEAGEERQEGGHGHVLEQTHVADDPNHELPAARVRVEGQREPLQVPVELLPDVGEDVVAHEGESHGRVIGGHRP